MTSSELQSMHGTYKISDINAGDATSLIQPDQIPLGIKHVR